MVEDTSPAFTLKTTFLFQEQKRKEQFTFSQSPDTFRFQESEEKP